MVDVCRDTSFAGFARCQLVVLAAVFCRPTAPQNVSFFNGLPENFTAASDAAIDVQYTSCKVITDRIVATAEGKFSRFCHGICNINETNARLDRIETLLKTDTENIKNKWSQLQQILIDINNINSDGKPRPRGRPDADTQRLGEIGAYNGTVFSVQDGGAGGRRPAQRLQPATAFVYYWRVEAFWRLTFADGRARSPPFYVSPRGYRLALAVHSDAAARTVRVAAVPAAGEYDAQLRWPFAHRLRLSVLDQTDVAPEDIVSHVWDDVRCAGPAADDRDGVCAFMEFRHDVLTYRRYAAGDGLLVKLTVFL